MAKRRRLDAPTSPMEIALANRERAAPPPIAQVTGEAATVAAAQDAIGEVEKARQEGRLVISVEIAQITRDHLTRDRMGSNTEDMEALMRSVHTHGQRTPIEVVQTETGYGLISGWRRLAALQALGKTHVNALIRQPQNAGEAYVAMVEENEIRANLSYYERARIAVKAAASGAFEDTETALKALFGAASRAKRSKIRSFVALYEALDDVLEFPDHIPERLGLKLAAALKDGRGAALTKALIPKAKTPEAEMARLTQALAPPQASKPGPTKLGDDLYMDIKGKGAGRRVTLSGAGLTDDIVARLTKALKG